MRRLPRWRRQPGWGGVSSLAAQQAQRTEVVGTSGWRRATSPNRPRRLRLMISRADGCLSVTGGDVGGSLTLVAVHHLSRPLRSHSTQPGRPPRVWALLVVCGFIFQGLPATGPHHHLQSEIWTNQYPVSSEGTSRQCETSSGSRPKEHEFHESVRLCHLFLQAPHWARALLAQWALASAGKKRRVLRSSGPCDQDSRHTVFKCIVFGRLKAVNLSWPSGRHGFYVIA